jgi:hypothetical protein
MAAISVARPAAAEPAQVIVTSISRYGTPTTVSISTSAWTKVPSSRTLNSRTEVVLDVPASNNANMVAHVGNCTSTSIATTVRPIELVKGEPDRTYQLGGDVCLWVLSLHTAAENLHFQELSRRNGPS